MSADELATVARAREHAQLWAGIAHNDLMVIDRLVRFLDGEE